MTHPRRRTDNDGEESGVADGPMLSQLLSRRMRIPIAMEVHSKYNQEEAGAEMACHPRTTILWCMTWAPTRKLYKRLGPFISRAGGEQYHQPFVEHTIMGFSHSLEGIVPIHLQSRDI
jgi:hypothetical protein